MYSVSYTQTINTLCIRMRRSFKLHIANVEYSLQHKHKIQGIFHRILFLMAFIRK